jgi:preprotein translocase subunit SecA
MLRNFLTKLVGSESDKALARLSPLVQRCAELEPEYEKLSEEELRAKTDEFRARYNKGERLDDLMPEAFAAVREASRRVNNMRHYDVQLVGGALLHQGKIPEMRTGEGKTLVATCPLYLNAITGKGVHLVTQNDYLAKRDAQWMGRVYHALGMSIGIIQSAGDGHPDGSTYVYDPTYPSSDDRLVNLRPVRRREAYQCDITYGTNNEFGFDYLRDNMTQDLADCVQRVRQNEEDPSKNGQPLLYFAVIDEVDNLLIDEARTPLIISGPADEPSKLYSTFAQLVRRLQASQNNDPKNPDGDYIVEAKSKNVTITEEGIEKIEKWLGIDNLYSAEHAEMTPYLDNALRAYVVFEKDRDYVVDDKGEIIIVDEFTGRLMYGRRFSEGLHQAIEAKENVKVQRESLTYATITFQNFFRMYEKLGGMTGTAKTEEEEFFKIYNLEVVPLPTNIEYMTSQKKLIEQKDEFVDGTPINTYVDAKTQRKYFKRLDYSDLVYKNHDAKFKAVVDEIAEVHATGRPVLVGTIAIETSEMLSKMLLRKGVSHQVLNAKQHEKEAGIVAQAGRSGTVTIATNMAGRGVDILLGGSPEGLARENLRKQGKDLNEISKEAWAEALALAEADCAEDKKRVQSLGGMHVIGTERHEARRIDNQLRGRCARQGDPGSSRFYVSLDDELMRRFGGERVKALMDRMNLEEDVPMEYGILSKSIEQAQEKVEGYNFDMRKHVIQYDDVINKQRAVIYAQRRTILEKLDLRDAVLEMVGDELEDQVKAHCENEDFEQWDVAGLKNAVAPIVGLAHEFDPKVWQKGTRDDIIEALEEKAEQRYSEGIRESAEAFLRILSQQAVTFNVLENSARDLLSSAISGWAKQHFARERYLMLFDTPFALFQDDDLQKLRAVFFDALRLVRDRSIMIQAVDKLWVRHLTDLDELREGIGLRAYGQRDPLVAYRVEASATFENMVMQIREQISNTVFNVKLNPQAAEEQNQRQQSRGAMPQRQVRPPQRLPTRSKPNQAKPVESKATTANVPAPVAAVASGAVMRATGALADAKINVHKLGRNDICPFCNSGKKLKHCNCDGAKRWRGEK